MKIHTISTYEEFTEEEIKDVVNHVQKLLRPLRKQLKGAKGTILIKIQSDKTRFDLIGFSTLHTVLINHRLRNK